MRRVSDVISVVDTDYSPGSHQHNDRKRESIDDDRGDKGEKRGPTNRVNRECFLAGNLSSAIHYRLSLTPRRCLC